MAFTNQCLCLALIFVLLGICIPQGMSRTLQDVTMYERYQQWMARYGRVYENSIEQEKRFNIFKENVALIEAFNNANEKPYKLAVNEFADLTNEEFKTTRNRFKGHMCSDDQKTASFKYENVTAVPSTMDWRKKGAVTPVKDQGQCGKYQLIIFSVLSLIVYVKKIFKIYLTRPLGKCTYIGCCWAFSAVAAIEGINQISNGKLLSLSEQELVDCDVKGEDEGCNGGLMDNAFEFIQKNNGITTEANYPYEGVDGTCIAKKEANHAAKITGHEDVPANNEKALLIAVANQPVSVAIDAGGSAFQFYSSGVFTGDCGTELDHGVTAVGYGVDDEGTEYWLVKNSWGTSWGEEGYIRMQRDVAAKEGLCGIAMQASYPTA